MNRLIGAILIITAESLGGGMIAIPAVTARIGFLGATLVIIITWFFMTIGAFLFL